MLSLRRLWLPILVATLGLSAAAIPAEALTTYVGVTGISTGPGVCDITIESFGLLKSGIAQPMTVPPPPYVIDVPIPGNSPPANTAKLIRDHADATLPAEYVVTIPIGNPNVVRIERLTGTFTMTVNSNVPGQVIERINLLPSAGPAGLLALAVLLAAVASLCLVPRRRSRNPAV